MKTLINKAKYNPLTLLAVLTATAVISPFLHAAEDQEASSGGTIYDRYWIGAEFPLPWYLHQNGVINNDALGAGTPNVSNADAITEISQAFAAWSGVATANVSFSAQGLTPTGTSGCDRTNIITWSDTGDFSSPSTTIARGIGTRYSGAPLVLDAVNRNTIACSDGQTVALDPAIYPDGMTLMPGTLLDMDMSFNSTDFDFVTSPNATPGVADIEAIAVHEFGHMIALSHTSLAYTSTSHRATMYPAANTNNIASQNNMKTLELDDQVAVSRTYPAAGFWPTGSAPYSTGAISGSVLQADGTAAQGIRVWAYNVADTGHPVVESYSATDHDWDPAIQAGDYILPGLPPGNYYVCIVPWNNGVGSDDPSGNYFNRTAAAFNTDEFYTECYDHAAFSTGIPAFGASVTPVSVNAGVTTGNIDFVTSQNTDIMLIMDRSGSMSLNSGTPSVTKLQALQAAANEFIDYLDLAAGNQLGLVQFEEILQPLTPVFDLQPLNAANVGDAHDAINTMSTGGWTNIIAGVTEGINQLTTSGTPHSRQVIVLFSDGKHNRPVGSDLNDINDPVVDNDIVFYSIGFGTDVDDAILSTVAANSGGIHVNEQDLDALALSKHFLTIGSMAIDESVVIDPRYILKAGDKAVLTATSSKDDSHLTFAVNWITADPKRLKIRITGPDGKCAVSQGTAQRTGNNYRLIRIPLPYNCNGKKLAAGNWTLRAEGNRFSASEEEQISIMVLGKSGLRLFAGASARGDGALLTARLVRNGRIQSRAEIIAELLPPLPPSLDSEKQDGAGTTQSRATRRAEPRKPISVRLYDDGSHGDRKAGDGIFSAVYRASAPGIYRARVIAQTPGKARQSVTRETVTSFVIGKR